MDQTSNIVKVTNNISLEDEEEGGIEIGKKVLTVDNLQI